MQQKSNRYNKSTHAVEELLGKMYAQARLHFGDAITSFWFYDGDLCPACTRRPIGTIKFKNKDALSLNAFIYRERGVLIGYFLCENCARQIFRDAQKNPYTQTPVHTEIERNLIAAYHSYLGKLAA